MFTASDLVYHPTIPILEPEDAAEVGRVRLLSDLITPLVGPIFPDEEGWGPGGRPPRSAPLPSGLDLSQVKTVLELGCGQGYWALDVAFAHPELEVAGIDASRVLIDTANRSACAQMLTNASFGHIDWRLLPFDFSDQSFDLLTASFLCNRLQEEQFPPLFAECARLLRPGGWMRLVECESGYTSSAAIERLSLLYAQAVARAGLHPLLTPGAPLLSRERALRRKLAEAGFVVSAASSRLLSFSLEDEAYAAMRTVIALFFEEIKPFVLRMQVTEEASFTQMVEQAAREIRQPDFWGHWSLLVLWARNGDAAVSREPAISARRDEQTGGTDVDDATG